MADTTQIHGAYILLSSIASVVNTVPGPMFDNHTTATGGNLQRGIFQLHHASWSGGPLRQKGLFAKYPKLALLEQQHACFNHDLAALKPNVGHISMSNISEIKKPNAIVTSHQSTISRIQQGSGMHSNFEKRGKK